MENNKTKIEERQEKEKSALLAILKEMPIIEVACKRVGISRGTFYRWQQEDKIFKRQSMDAMDQGIEFINDMSESQLITLIKKEKMPAISMWLKNNHKRYGAKGRSYTPINSTEDLTIEEENLVLEALAMASGKTYGDKSKRRIHSKNMG
jgi:predicted site-specific integrase-resolvase